MWRSGALLTPVLLFGTLMGGRRVEAAVPWPNFVVCVLVLEVNTMWFWAAPYPQPPLLQAHGTSKDGETGEGGWIKKRGGDCNRIGWMESDKVLRIKMSSSREEINRTQAKTLRLFSSGGFGVCVQYICEWRVQVDVWVFSVEACVKLGACVRFLSVNLCVSFWSACDTSCEFNLWPWLGSLRRPVQVLSLLVPCLTNVCWSSQETSKNKRHQLH